MSSIVSAVIAAFKAKTGISITSTVTTPGFQAISDKNSSGSVPTAVPVWMSDNVVVAFYATQTTNSLYAAVLTISGTTITQNAEFVVAASGNSPRVGKLTASTMLCCFLNGSGIPQAVVVSISGTTLTKGTQIALDAASGNGGGAITSLAVTPSGNQGVYTFGVNGGVQGSNQAAVLMTVSGTTITKNNTVYTSGSTVNFGSQRVVAVNNTEILAIYNTATVGLYANVYSISGSTLSRNAGVRLTTVSDTINLSDIAACGDGVNAVVASRNSTAPAAMKMGVIGVSAGNPTFYGHTTLDTTGQNGPVGISMNTTTAGIVVHGTAGNNINHAARVFAISGNTVSIGSPTTVYVGAGGTASLAACRCTDSTSIMINGRPSVSPPQTALLVAS